MAYELRVDEDAGIVEARFSGGYVLDEHVEARRRVLNLCRETGIRRVLADLTQMRAGEQASDFLFYAFGSSWQSEEIPPDMRFACVLPLEVLSAEGAAFAADVSGEHSAPIKMCRSSEEARAWLLHGDTGPPNPANGSGAGGDSEGREER